MVSENRHRRFEDWLQLFRSEPIRSSVLGFCRLKQNRLVRESCINLYFLLNLCICPLQGSVEYECIMAVFALSLGQYKFMLSL